jgi:hypothetical protein
MKCCNDVKRKWTSLGYEASDIRLRHLGRSQTCPLASANACSLSPVAASVSPVSARSAASRLQIGIQIRCLSWALVRLWRSPRRPRWSSRHRRPPSGERGKRRGSRWSTLPAERPWPAALGLLGLPWADGDEMGRLPHQPPDNLDQAATSILEPEVPAGGTSGCSMRAVRHGLPHDTAF